MGMAASILVHLGAGIGNIVLATPLLIALHELGFTVDVLLAADYPETADLLRPWSVVREVFPQSAAPDSRDYDHIAPALPPFYAARFGRMLANLPRALRRPPDRLFYENEQRFYLHFARALGWANTTHPLPTLPIGAAGAQGVTLNTLVLAPGCKTGEMAAKRWPHFAELSAAFEDVAVVGTPDDLRRADGSTLQFPMHVHSFAGRLSLRETAELMAGAGAVAGNDSGLTHIAAAVGTPTLMIFGPTPHACLGPFPPNTRILRRDLPCEPCWMHDRLRACAGRLDCLGQLDVQTIIRVIRSLNWQTPRAIASKFHRTRAASWCSSKPEV